jgi:hypothetical protein
MRTRGRALPFAAALAATVLALAPSLALAATSEQLRTLAETTWKMTCQVNAADITCLGPASRIAEWHALIGPTSGQFDTLITDSREFDKPNDTNTVPWMSDMHTTACGDPKGVSAFVQSVWALTQLGDSVPTATVGTCTMDGGYVVINDFLVYRVKSVYKPPPPPTPSPTAKPTPSPTHSPAPTPTAAATATLEPSPGATPPPSIEPTVTIAPSEAPSLTPAPSSAEVVSPVEATPAPTPNLPTGPCLTNCGESSFINSIPSLDSVATDATSVGGSLLLALLLVIIGFAAELFNNTVENNYASFAGLLAHSPWSSFGGWLQRHGRLGVGLFLALTALVSSFVDPTFGLNARSIFEFLGFLVGVTVVLASFKLPPMLAHRRKTGELGRLRPLPWALVIAAVFVIVSRVGNLQPGYLYGIVLGAIFTREVSDDDEGRETIYGSIWTLLASLLAWIGLTWVRGLGLTTADALGTFALSALGCILVSGLEATAFGLMPLRFMPGYAIYRWNRPVWAVLFGLSVFAFIHILIGPSSGYVSSLNPAAFVAALGVFAVFGAVSIGTWAYFRFRPQPAPEAAEP